MSLLVPCRGSVYRVDPTGSGALASSGFYYSDQLFRSSDEDTFLITSVSPSETEVVLPIVTLENTRILYTFGSNIGDIVVSGLILLGKSGTPGRALKSILDFYQQYKVSAQPDATVTFSGPNASWRLYVVGLQIGDAEGVTNTQGFAITGKIAEPR